MLNQLHSLLSWSHDYTGALHRAQWPARLGVWNITCLLVDTVTLCRVLLSPVELWWCPSLTSFLLTWCWCRPASMLWKDILRHWGATKSQPSVRFSQSILHQHSDISHIDSVWLICVFKVLDNVYLTCFYLWSFRSTSDFNPNFFLFKLFISC